jgi:hypothetical protein
LVGGAREAPSPAGPGLPHQHGVSVTAST